MNEDINIIEDDITDLATRQQSGGLLDASSDNILYLAERADKYIDAMNRIMQAALKITSENDWCIIGGKPYLQETGAMKVARLFGICVERKGKPTVTVDSEGYKTFTCEARFWLKDQYVDCEGSRSMKEDFFAKAGKDKPLKKPDEIEERDVRMAAYTNCLNNGIKRLIPGLRGLSVTDLERAGINTGKAGGYTFKESSRGGAGKAAENTGLVCSKCGAPITQAEASYSQGRFGAMLCRTCQKEASK